MLWLLLGAVLFAADMFAKFLVYTNMSQGDSIPLINGIFHITYAKNTGAAFSIFEGNNTILSIITAVLLIAIVGFLVYKKPSSKILTLALVMIVAGGAGNLMDRFRFGYVVDFFDFRLINFAVFNTADSFVVIGACLLAIYMLFLDNTNMR